MSVVNLKEDVNYISGGNPIYSLYKSIETQNFTNARYLINEVIQFDKLKQSELKSVVSLVLKYYILTNSKNIENFYNDNKNSLMKRDILLYCNHFYHSDFDKSMKSFKYLISKYKLTSDNLSFIVSNKLDFFLKLLDGYYINLDIDKGSSEYKQLKFYEFSEDVVNSTLHKITNFINIQKVKIFCDNLKEIQKKKIIIDAGNVLYSVRGEITVDGYLNLIKIVEFFKRIDYVPIIIIHTRHLKKRFNGEFKENEVIKCIEKLKKINKSYIFETPYQKNDDFYIIYTGLSLSCQIISNDNYRDHIYNFRTNSHESDDNQIENYIDDLVVKYDPSTLDMEITQKYISNCIQVTKKKVYIPTNNHKFIEYDFS